MNALKLLIIDDDPLQLKVLEKGLRRNDLEITTSSDPVEGLAMVARIRPDMVLLDQVMPKMDGLEVLSRIVERDPTVEVIMMSAYYSTESAVAAILNGASDYLEKPSAMEKLEARIERHIDDARERKRQQEIDRELLEASYFAGVIGRSPAMSDVLVRVRRIAPHYRTALVTGDTGTGKELIARALHRLSPVASGPFMVCNCSAIVETLFESELFGHVRGAFTGAVRDRSGLFEQANGGTLFLDEIGELPISLQPKLLRAVQQQEIQVVGSSQPRTVNVRIVAATNRDLRRSVAAREFRDDLLYRLAMVEIHLPRLAEHKEDLPLLQQHFLRQFAAQFNKPVESMTRRAQMILARYHWPGNVRELENVMGSSVMMAQGVVIDAGDLPEHLRSSQDSIDADLMSLEAMERSYAQRVVERLGNKVLAAEVLGISRATLYRLLGKSDDPSQP